jgi:ribonuclease HI
MEKIIEIWTDGGCWPNPGNGGWACILKFGEHTKELSGFVPNTTNNRMELEAIIQSLKALKEGSKEYKIKIHADSEWAIHASNGTWKIKKNLDKVAEVRKIIADGGWDIEWIWVKGHDGHTLNERCDQLAKEARLKKE